LKILQDIWIIEKSGIVVFHRQYDNALSPQLFGAMMSALNHFAEQLTEGGLSNFDLQNTRFTLIKQGGLMFVAISSKKFKQKKVNKELKKVSNKFINLYADKLESFKGRLGVFDEFEKEIEDSIEKKS